MLINRLESKLSITSPFQSTLSPIFNNEQEYESWKKEKEQHKIEYATLQPGLQEATIGIDSGSTTTKIVVLDNDNLNPYSYYHDNNGNPIKDCRERITETD